MCGRYYRRSDKQKIAEQFHAKNDLSDIALSDADYNVAPSTFQPIIRQSRDTADRELQLLRWGLIPFWTKDLNEFKGFSTINARAETITKSATYRDAFKKRRCIVPASGFYEWKKLSSTSRRPYAFDLANGQMLGLAGLWEAWKEPKDSPQSVDRWIQSFTIITTEANELMAPVHNRMPVILRPPDFDRWLDREETAQPPIDLLRPFPADEMEAFEVSRDVGNVRNNSPELLNSK